MMRDAARSWRVLVGDLSFVDAKKERGEKGRETKGEREAAFHVSSQNIPDHHR